jgi:mannosyltransferase OCH1-like enzyme
MEQLSITSFLQNGHEYHLYCYDEIKNVPTGVILRDATEIVPGSEIFYYPRGPEKGSVAAFANLFRYKLLLERGGWWVDTDVVCLRPFDFNAPIVLASQRASGGKHTTNAVLKLPPNHMISRLCFEASQQEDRTKLTWAKTGPTLVDRIVREQGLQHFVQEPEVFCPLDYSKWRLLLESDPKRTLFTSKSYAIHLWHELWRRARIELNPASKQSEATQLFSELALQFGINPK